LQNSLVNLNSFSLKVAVAIRSKNFTFLASSSFHCIDNSFFCDGGIRLSSSRGSGRLCSSSSISSRLGSRRRSSGSSRGFGLFNCDILGKVVLSGKVAIIINASGEELF